MTSMEVSFDASESPEAQPTSLAAEPSSPSAAPASSRPPPPAVDAQPAHRAKVTRTYGRPKPVEDVTPAKELAATEGLALDRNSTLVIPDSEPASKPQHPSSDSVDDGDTTMRAGHGQATSSPTRRDVQSTDPTSEDEEPVRPANSRSKTSLPVHADTDADSSDSDNDAASGDDTGALAFLKRRPAIKDLLANVDRVFDSRLKDTTAATTVVFPTSSTLPPLTVTNESGSSRPASSSQRSPPRWRAASPSSPSHDLDDIEALLTSTQSVESEDVVPTARSRARKPRAILDSDDEEAEEEKAPQRNAAPRPSSSGDEGVRPSLSKQDRVRQLWQKKVEANEAKERERQMKLAAARGEEYVEPEPVTLVEDLIEDDSDGRTGKKKAKARKSSEKKAKSLSKKELEEMNRVTASLNRQQEVRLVATRKVGLSVADALKQHSVSSLPPPTVDRTVSISAQPEAITLSSSSDAIVTSSPSRDVAQTPVFKLSSKALGKQRASSPIADGDHATPVPHRARKPLAPAGWPERKRVPTPVAADDDEDEDLLAPDEMIRRDNEKREKARRSKEFQAKKLAAAKAAKAKAAQGNDSDTDLEIEMPGAPKRTARGASTQAENTLAVFSRTPARPRNDPRKILARHAGIDLAHPPSEDALPSESQLDAAGHEFGRHLDTRFHENMASSRKPRPFGVKSSSRAKRAGVPEQITHEKLNGSTLEKARLQNLAMRTKKQTLARQAQQNKPELQSVDVAALIKSKREKEDQEDQEEEDEDGDYVDEDEEEEAQASMYAGSDSERDETGSGDDEPAPAVAVAKSAPGSDDEAEVDSEGELVMPPSSQNSERLRQATQGDADEEDEDEEMPPPATTRRPASKIRIVPDDDDESRASDTPAPTELAPTEVARTATSDESQGAAAPAKVAFGALLGDEGDAGGFSQFFDSQFSQGAGGDDEGEGFLRPANDELSAPAPTMFAAQPLISTAERAADVARLEARGGFNDFEPATPRELPAPRQYINDKGFLTQTRPANLFDSPSDSPAYYRQSLSTRDSQSQALDETQPATAQTPTQLSRDPTRLRRVGALTPFDSLAPLAATEVETQLEDAQLEETRDALPSAAQQPTAPRNAFEALKAGAAQADAPPPEAQQVPRRHGKNAFVDAEANLSDEEVGLGLGGISGDEDEDGHDAELESLVDNEEVDRDVQEEQDKLARSRFQEDQEKAEAEDLKRAQRIADGKERQKRKGLDLFDDDFDDEHVSRNGHREKKARVESLTVGQLKDNAETQAFANVLAQGFVPTAKAGEYAFLETPHTFSDNEDADADIDEAELDDGAQDVFGRVDAPELRVRSHREARLLAVQQSCARRAFEERGVDEDDDVEMLSREARGDDDDEMLDERVLRDLSPQVNLGLSSSPAAPLKLNLKHRAVAATASVAQAAHVEDYTQIDSQTSVFGVQHSTAVKYSERDESSITTATVGGGRSAVTSFKRTSVTPSTSAAGGGKAGSNGGKSGTALGPKSSRFAAVRKGGFA
ncbi:hypothetical protein DMC30DRAFT_386421 [Rhodotorula diobovata]|uniref:DNA replication checkpoint mediator MRC1 domain-containing protein n=1 Tax=Rhodotorula diobovata TaxID=5288 RepID=A0A5C5G8V7_9BASI|nr:hypothetical protein DMC30DRAFT_386421 [Rhodotorula diobovata]